MTPHTMEIIGLLAGCCTTGAFLPQVIHTWRTKSTNDISLRMYLLLVTGISLWIAYGLLIDSLSIVVANSVTLVLASAVLVMKLLYDHKKPNP